MVTWKDVHDQGKAAEILVPDAMSSEESCYEGEEDNRRVVKYSRRKLSWESKKLKKIKKKLDKAYNKALTKRAKERILPRVDANEPSEREAPDGLPEWAIKERDEWEPGSGWSKQA